MISNDKCLCKLVEVNSITIGIGVKFASADKAYVDSQKTSFRSVIAASLNIDPSKIRVTVIIK